MELLSVVERLEAIDRSAVSYDPQRCLHSHDKFVECEDCLGICPVEAIQPDKPPRFDSDACAGCLACLPLCPTGAYSADDAVRDLLNCVTHVESAQIELLCQANPRGQEGLSEESVGIRLRGCLAGLGSGTYLALAALGLDQVSVRLEACAKCPWGTLKEQVEKQVNTANRLLSASDKTSLVQVVTELDEGSQRPLWEAKNPPLSRRDLFMMLSRQGQTALARAIENEGAPASKQAGRGHLRLVNAIEHLTQTEAGKNMSLAGLGFGMLAASETCTACGSCARLCPTGAIHFEMDQEASTYTLSFTPPKCIACQACLHVCADSALSLDSAPTLDQVFGAKEALVLRSGELSRCERCHVLFAARPGIHLCSLCEFRQKNPFGSRLPQGFNLSKAKES
jgi:ferredoxin